MAILIVVVIQSWRETRLRGLTFKQLIKNLCFGFGIVSIFQFEDFFLFFLLFSKEKWILSQEGKGFGFDYQYDMPYIMSLNFIAASGVVKWP